MIAVSDQFLEAIRQPHKMVVKALLTTQSGLQYDLPVMDGTVTIDRTADQRRGLDLTVPPVWPEDHPLVGMETYPSLPTDPLSATGAEIQAWRGVEFANNTAEYVSLGVFRIQEVSRDVPGGPVTITGWDRSIQVADERFVKPRKLDPMLAVDLMQLLVGEVYDGSGAPGTAVFDVQTADATKIKKHTVDRDRWPEVQRVAKISGTEIYPDENGMWIIADAPSPSDTPVWAVDAGENGVLVTATNSVTREGVPNAVIALGDGTPTVFVAASFSHNSGSGWPTSESGDNWNVVTGSSGDFDVSGGTGRIQAAAGASKQIQAAISDSADVDVTGVITFLPGTAAGTAITGGDLQASVDLRANGAGSSCVRINLTYQQSNGHLLARPQSVSGGSPTNLGSGDKDLGAYNAPNQINVRLRVKGNVVRAKAWLTTEPKGWDWNTTQSDVTAAGALECRLFRSGGNTNGGGPQVTFSTIKATATQTWYSIAHDDNPNSPTYWNGPYGHVPRFYSSPLIRTQAQCDKVARTQLNDHLGAVRTISFTHVPNPALEAGDVVTVRYPNINENHIIDVITIPLKPDGTMTGETRAADWTAQ